MRKNHHNPNKVPPFKPDPEHWTKKVHSWKAKVAYDTEDDAWEFLNQNPKLKAIGYTCYLCKVCSRYHIGRLHNKYLRYEEVFISCISCCGVDIGIM